MGPVRTGLDDDIDASNAKGQPLPAECEDAGRLDFKPAPGCTHRARLSLRLAPKAAWTSTEVYACRKPHAAGSSARRRGSFRAGAEEGRQCVVHNLERVSAVPCALHRWLSAALSAADALLEFIGALCTDHNRDSSREIDAVGGGGGMGASVHCMK